MNKLKNILQSNRFYIYLIIIVVIITTINIYIVPHKSKFLGTENIMSGRVVNIDIKDNSINLTLKSKELIKAYMYFKKKKDFSIHIGDYIQLNGELISPKNNTNPNTYNYKKYLYNNHIYYTFEFNEYEVLEKNTNVLYKLKDYLLNRRVFNDKVTIYIRALLFGSNKELDNDIKDTYQNIGITHLFATSGMHISFLILIINKILSLFKIKDKYKDFILIIIIIFFMFLTSFTASILRSGLFFILLTFNKLFKLKISTLKVLIITISLLLLIDSFLIFNIGFLYSSSISITLICCNKYLNSSNYFLKVLKTSFISFLISIPITLYNFYELNVLAPLNNVILIPVISLIVFPLCIITYIFPFLGYILLIFINITELISIILSKISIVLILGKPNYWGCILYYIDILIFIKFKNKLSIIPLLITLLIHYNLNIIIPHTYVLVLDVNQGDSTIIHVNNKTFLIDTGGNINNNYYISNNIILPVLKSYGIKKINYLILTHGDIDHMGESINLVNNFKVENVIFNCGLYNKLESDLIKVLDKKETKYYACIKELNVGKYKLHFLNTGTYDNENDNSNVIYFNYSNYKFLFMGDSGIQREKDILENLNLSNIDFLKVGHHGSDTSSSEEFINQIQPKYSLISVGKNNRYGHPKKTVLDILSNSKVYRTDIDGSVEIRLNKDEYKIKTYSP